MVRKGLACADERSIRAPCPLRFLRKDTVGSRGDCKACKRETANCVLWKRGDGVDYL